jgi:CHAT domain-containing protein
MGRQWLHVLGVWLGRRDNVYIQPTAASPPEERITHPPVDLVPETQLQPLQAIASGDTRRLDAVRRALDAFVDVPAWDQTCAVLMREQTLLLSLEAEEQLSARLRRLTPEPPFTATDHPQLVTLALKYALLRGARRVGIAATWERVSTEHRYLARAVSSVPITGDIPIAFQPLIDRINRLSRGDDLRQKIDLINEVLHRLLADGTGTTDERVLIATVRTELGSAWTQWPEGDEDSHLEQAIVCYRQAEREFTLADYMPGSARVRSYLGRVYWWRIEGNRRENLEQAIGSCEQALQVFTADGYPNEFAHTQNDLGLAYIYRIAGDPRANLEQAITCLTEALRVRTLVESPLEFAQSASHLGFAYVRRVNGSRRENVEQAIDWFTQALAIFRAAGVRSECANTQNKLGIAYVERLAGNRQDNQEQAIACFTKALEVFTRTEFAFDYARTHNNLGETYRRRLAGQRRANVEAAIVCFSEALHVWTATQIPSNHAIALQNLGEAYLARIAGEWTTNLEQAIACLTSVLRIWTPADFPIFYATTQRHLGTAYQSRIAGDRQKNLEQATACFNEALQVFTLSELPLERRDTLLDLAWLAYDARASDATAQHDMAALQIIYQQAHQAFAAARRVQAELGWLEYDAQGHASLHGAHPEVQQMYARDAWCLYQLGDLYGAVVALEAGRAHALAEAQAIAGATLDGVCAEHRASYMSAYEQWQGACLQNDRLAQRTARTVFLEVRQAVRAHCSAAFLPDEPTYADIAGAAASDQALLYLTAADQGGVALVVLPSPKTPAKETALAAEEEPTRSPQAIALPCLTKQAIDAWLVRQDVAGQIVGGYQYVLQESAAPLLQEWVRGARDAQEQTQRLAVPLRDLALALPASMSTLCSAVTEMVSAWRAEADLLSGGALQQQAKARQIRARLTQPIGAALEDRAIINDLSWLLREAELERLLDELAAAFMIDLRSGLDALRLDDPDQPIALIPCGRLGVLPLHAAWTRGDATTGERIPFLETCQLTVQPSARALASARASQARLPTQQGPVLTIGDPRPTASPPLAWAEVEAEMIASIGRRAQRPASEAIIGEEATLVRVTAALGTIRREQSGAWIQVAGHGHADPTDPTNCYLLLAHNERLTLAQLQRQRLLEGVRGLGASGCATGLGDIETAPDELNSFAAGVLQAGAPCAVAMLWSVSDRATFLLMLRFAQGLFGEGRKGEVRAGAPPSPARALRMAITWLRTATQAQIENALLDIATHSSLHGIQRIQPLQSEFAELARDAVRGSILPKVRLVDDDGDSIALTSFDAGSIVTVLSSLHRQVQLPYAHPIYWAAAVVYGW